MGAALLQQLTPAQKRTLAVGGDSIRTWENLFACVERSLFKACSGFLPHHRIVNIASFAQAAIFTGGIAVAGGQSLQHEVRRAQKEQQRLCAEVEQKESGKAKRPKVAVDEVFARRLYTILGM